jgi:hypothetical protein
MDVCPWSTAVLPVGLVTIDGVRWPSKKERELCLAVVLRVVIPVSLERRTQLQP